jgi:tetratricopeptide (TPR) repeat protein
MTELRIPARAAWGLAATASASVLALWLTFPSDRTLGLMFENDGQIDTASQFLQTWNRHHPVDYESRLHTADLLVMTVHPEQAVRALEDMARDWPNDAQILRRLVEIEDSLLMVDETLVHLERLAVAAPRDPDVLRRLADHYRWKGRAEPLLQTLLKLVRLEDAPDERAELIDTLLSNRRYEDLIAWFSPGIDEAPQPVEQRLALYEAYIRTDRLDEATAQLEHVLELAPDRIEYLRPIADRLVERGLFEQAVALYKERIDREPRTARQYQVELDELFEAHGEQLVEKGQLKDAVKRYRDRIARAPLDVHLRLELAGLYGGRANEVAVGELEQLLRLAPTSVEGWVALAEHQSWRDKLGEAVKAYRQALHLAPANRAIRRALAQHLQWSDRQAEAIEQYRVLAGPGGDDVDREALFDMLLEAEQGREALTLAEHMSPTPRHRYLVALAAHAAGDNQRALPELLEWTHHETKDVRAWTAVLEAATALDEPDLALTALRRLQSLKRGAQKEGQP